MVSPGQFVLVLATVLGTPPATVELYDRVLLEANLRTKGGRGLSAARLAARDAANLLSALLATSQPKDAATAVALYAATRPRQPQSSKKAFMQAGIPELGNLPAEHSFIDALEALIASATDGSLAEWLATHAAAKRSKKASLPIIDIAATSPGALGDIRIAGVIEGKTAQVRYMTPGPWLETNQLTTSAVAGEGPDLAQSRSVTARTIIRIAEALAAKGNAP